MNFRDTTTKRRSESIASNRPKSRGLHPVGALARIHRKKSLPIGGRQERKARHKDPNRLRTIGPNLGDYTQWVRLRAPTGRKVSRLEEGQKEKQNIKIRTDCEQSARISGTTPSGCACAHPPAAKCPDWRRAKAFTLL